MKLLMIVSVLLILAGCHSAAVKNQTKNTTFGTVFDLNFSGEPPESVYVIAKKCLTNSCENTTGKPLPIINGDIYIDCVKMNTVPGDDLFKCIEKGRLPTNKVNSDKISRVAIEVSIDDFQNDSFMTQFFTEDNKYLPVSHISSGFSCSSPINYCYISPSYAMNFGKGLGATSIIKGLFVVNALGQNPVQLQPGSTYEFHSELCSAFSTTISASDVEIFTPPKGYSTLNHSSNVIAELRVNGSLVKTFSKDISFDQNECINQMLLSWTPSNDDIGSTAILNISSTPYGNNILSSVTTKAETSWNVQTKK